MGYDILLIVTGWNGTLPIRCTIHLYCQLRFDLIGDDIYLMCFYLITWGMNELCFITFDCQKVFGYCMSSNTWCVLKKNFVFVNYR